MIMDASVGGKDSNASIIPSYHQTQPSVRDNHSRRRQAVHLARRFIFLGAVVWLLSSVYGVSIKTFYEHHRPHLDNVKTTKGHGSDSDFNWDKVSPVQNTDASPANSNRSIRSES